MTRCAIWYHLVQFKKREKYPWRSVTFIKVVGFHKFSFFFFELHCRKSGMRNFRKFLDFWKFFQANVVFRYFNV